MVEMNQPFIIICNSPPRNNKYENRDVEDYFELKVT